MALKFPLAKNTRRNFLRLFLVDARSTHSITHNQLHQPSFGDDPRLISVFENFSSNCMTVPSYCTPLRAPGGIPRFSAAVQVSSRGLTASTCTGKLIIGHTRAPVTPLRARVRVRHSHGSSSSRIKIDSCSSKAPTHPEQKCLWRHESYVAHLQQHTCELRSTRVEQREMHVS